MKKLTIQNLLDPNFTEDIVLYDENKQPTLFSLVASIAYQDELYCLLTFKETTTYEAYVFKAIEVEDDVDFLYIEDETTIHEIFNIYYSLD